MSDYDRGAYTPQSDQPLTFDARRPRQGGSGQPLPLALIFSAVVLVALVVALILFYRNGVRGAGDPPQPVGTPVPAIKGNPPPEVQPGQATVGLQVYKAPAPGETEPLPTFTPGPEVPEPRPTAQAAPASPAPQPTAQAQAAKPQAVAAAPQTKAAPAPKPAASQPLATLARPAAKPATKPVATGGSGALVQIGAYSSDALASKGWSDVARAYPGPMSGKTKQVVPVERDGSTLYRTSIGGFASRAEAAAFCDQLKASGKTCIVKGG